MLITEPLHSFSSKREGQKILDKLVERYRLCRKLCGLYESSGPCFHYEIKECNGACAGKETPEEYNKRAALLIQDISDNNNIIIIDKGRNFDEYSIVKIENGKYIGFGFIERDIQISHPGLFDDYISRYDDNRDIQSIIRKYLSNNRVINIIRF